MINREASQTVKKHLQSIYREHNANGRMGALKAPWTLGLIPNNVKDCKRNSHSVYNLSTCAVSR
jgi:hypothetical protein